MQSTCHWCIVMRHGFDLIVNRTSTAVSAIFPLFRQRATGRSYGVIIIFV